MLANIRRIELYTTKQIEFLKLILKLDLKHNRATIIIYGSKYSCINGVSINEIK